MTANRLLQLALFFSAAGCNQIESAKKMAEAAEAIAESAKKAEAAGEAAKQNAAPGADPTVVEQQAEMAKALGAMQAMGQANGPIVNWRQLAPFLPDAIGEFSATRKLEGSTTKAGGFEVTKVERDYKNGERRLRVEITDAFIAGMLKAPFYMAATINEDSTEGFKKGTKIDEHTAIVEWKESSKRSTAIVLVADRFLVDVKVDPASSPEEAAALAKALGLAELAKVQPQPG